MFFNVTRADESMQVKYVKLATPERIARQWNVDQQQNIATLTAKIFSQHIVQPGLKRVNDKRLSFIHPTNWTRVAALGLCHDHLIQHFWKRLVSVCRNAVVVIVIIATNDLASIGGVVLLGSTGAYRLHLFLDAE